jgi:hypothetical protein
MINRFIFLLLVLVCLFADGRHGNRGALNEEDLARLLICATIQPRTRPGYRRTLGPRCCVPMRDALVARVYFQPRQFAFAIQAGAKSLKFDRSLRPQTGQALRRTLKCEWDRRLCTMGKNKFRAAFGIGD